MTVAGTRLIKKYPNRRLYDTVSSCYITLEDIKNLVLKHESFQIIDSKTSEDLTNTVLLQIVLELEQKGAPVFTKVMLEQLIRFYGNDFQAYFSQYLEKMFSMCSFSQASQINTLTDLRNIEFWKNLYKI